jgi:NTE family protein
MAPSVIDTPEARSEGQPGGLTELRDAGAAREAGIGLCLSGGGYRAMLFHIGTLWRLYDAGVLGTVKRISSVSGGSITAALLGLRWGRLSFRPAATNDDFVPRVVEPIRRLADQTLDVAGVIGGILLPGTIGDRIAYAYADHLYGESTL